MKEGREGYKKMCAKRGREKRIGGDGGMELLKSCVGWEKMKVE